MDRLVKGYVCQLASIVQRERGKLSQITPPHHPTLPYPTLPYPARGGEEGGEMGYLGEKGVTELIESGWTVSRRMDGAGLLLCFRVRWAWRGGGKTIEGEEGGKGVEAGLTPSMSDRAVTAPRLRISSTYRVGVSGSGLMKGFKLTGPITEFNKVFSTTDTFRTKLEIDGLAPGGMKHEPLRVIIEKKNTLFIAGSIEVLTLGCNSKAIWPV